ncbi:hypothetical protein TNCV_2136431 [Trichonephila clavipes]|nr:hypothetical protein TNCV_2136431 [Trichonephila clavipes]
MVTASPSNASNITDVLTVKAGVKVELLTGSSCLVVDKEIDLASGRLCDIEVLLKIIENLDDPVEVCSTLKQNFQSDNRSYHLLLFNQLVNCQMRSSEKVNLFASRLKGIADQLINIRKPMDEVYVSFIFFKEFALKIRYNSPECVEMGRD